MTKNKIKNIIIEEYSNLLLEKLEAKDLSVIRDLIRYEVAYIMFDLYKKRSVWV